MYHIAVLAEKEMEGQYYAEQIARFAARKASGVAGLNAAKHLRSIYPICGIIWCSVLDFSLHAFMLRVDYFLPKLIAEEAFKQGLIIWFERANS